MPNLCQPGPALRLRWQFIVEPGSLEPLGVSARFPGAPVFLQQFFGNGFGSQHARFHGGVRTLDLQHIEKAGVVADQHAAGKREFRQGLNPAFHDRPGAIGNARSPCQRLAHERVVLPALKFIERAQVRVLVGQIDDQAQRHLVVLQVIEERAARGPAQWPTERVDDLAGLVPLGRDVPQLLQADGIVLRTPACVEAIPGDELLAQVTAAAFGKDGVSRSQLVAGRIGSLLFPRRIDTHVAGGDARHHAVIVVEHFRRRESGKHVDAHALGLLAEPTAQAAEADRMVAVVVNVLGYEQGRDPDT